jgi:hypothetical protein
MQKGGIMGVLLQGFYKLRPNRAVPSPANGDPKTPWWWDRLAVQANDFRTAGFTAIWLPPVLKTSAAFIPGRMRKSPILAIKRFRPR